MSPRSIGTPPGWDAIRGGRLPPSNVPLRIAIYTPGYRNALSRGLNLNTMTPAPPGSIRARTWTSRSVVRRPTIRLPRLRITLPRFSHCNPGALPSNGLLGICRCMGSHFHDSTDYNGVAFSSIFNRVTRMVSHFFGTLRVRKSFAQK